MNDPRNPQFSPDQLGEVRRLQALYPHKQGALLPVLHLAQGVAEVPWDWFRQDFKTRHESASQEMEAIRCRSGEVIFGMI